MNGGAHSAPREADMALQRSEGTSYADAGLARRGMSLLGHVIQKTGLTAQTGANTNEIILFASALPNKILNTDKKGLLITIFGSVAGNANNKVVRVYLPATSGTKVLDSGNFGSNPLTTNAWFVYLYIFRTGANSQDVFAWIDNNTGTLVPTFTQTTLNSNSGIQFTVTGQNGTAAAADIVLRAVTVALLTEGGVQTAGGVLV